MCLQESSHITIVNPFRTYKVKSFDNLTLRIYTIGYPIMGESVLVLLCDGEKVLFTVLTDCYCTGCEESEYNHVAKVLTKNQVKQIDAFVWTHPDRDHSVGIENLLNCYDKEHRTEIFIPEGLIGKNQKTYCNEANNAIAYIYHYYSAKGSQHERRHIHTVATDDHEIRDLLTLSLVADDTEKPLECKFQFVLPYADDCNHADFWNMKLEHNLMSIVYSIKINGRNYVFTGDLMDDGTKRMNEEIFARLKYVKIPHHGSDQSKEFINRLRCYNCNGFTASVTRFNNSNDPKETTLRAYNNMGDVFYVNDEITHPMGCIETVVDVINDTCVTQCTGNAMKFRV